MKYKLTLLKDLPDYKAGTEVINISEDELVTGKYEFRHYVKELNFSQIFDLRNNPEWVRVDLDPRCDCETKDELIIRSQVIGYGRSLNVGVSFKDKEIYSWYDYACDSGTNKAMKIKYCPLCGRKL